MIHCTLSHYYPHTQCFVHICWATLNLLIYRSAKKRLKLIRTKYIISSWKLRNIPKDKYDIWLFIVLFKGKTWWEFENQVDKHMVVQFVKSLTILWLVNVQFQEYCDWIQCTSCITCYNMSKSVISLCWLFTLFPRSVIINQSSKFVVIMVTL